MNSKHPTHISPSGREVLRLIEAEARRRRCERLLLADPLGLARTLAEGHNAAIRLWCARQQRREATLRTSLATLLLIIIGISSNAAYAARPLRYASIDSRGPMSHTDIRCALDTMVHPQ